MSQRLPAVPGARPRGRIVRPLPETPLSARVERRDAIVRRLLGTADLGAATTAAVFAVIVVGDDRLAPGSLLLLPLVALLSKMQGLYDRDALVIRRSTTDEIPALFRLATLYTLLIWLGGGLFVAGELGRDQVFGLWMCLFAGTVLARFGARWLASSVTDKERCLVIGDAGSAGWVRARALAVADDRVEFVGQIPLRPVRNRAGARSDRHEWKAVEQAIATSGADRVIVVPEDIDANEELEAIRHIKTMGVKVSVMPRFLEVIGASAERDEIDGATLLSMRRYGLSRSSRVIKRSFDLVGGSLILVATAPLMVAIALMVKRDSPGPVIFRQRRIGLSDQPFEVFKFRTMGADAEEQKADLVGRNEAGGGLFKIADDPRITKFGRRLRRTSLDELPQIFNVMRGEMSLVGPRPLIVDEDSKLEGWQRRRLNLSPGMTGPWQVYGSARIPLHEMVKIDYLYGADWSLWLDVKMLLRTIKVVLRRSGL